LKGFKERLVAKINDWPARAEPTFFYSNQSKYPYFIIDG